MSSVLIAFISCDSLIFTGLLQEWKILLEFTRVMEFIVRQNRRLIIAPFCVRYVQLAAVSGQWPWLVDTLIFKITNNWAYKL